MIIKKDFYKEIYFIDSPEHLTDNQWNNLLMSGKMNWDKYFTPFKTKREHEVIKNVELIWLDSENAMRKYLKRLNPFLLLNFSLEHEKPCVLKFS